MLAHLPEGPAAGIAYSPRHRELFIATGTVVYSAPFPPGAQSIEPKPIAHVRTGTVAPDSDGDVHVTTSVAYDEVNDRLYVSVGSSCNACTESDDTRASIFSMRRDGSDVHKIAKRIRNAIALAIDPQTGALWAGDAGQDALPSGHPYEFADDVTSHSGVADYGWPDCEENHHAYAAVRCDRTVEPLVAFPAYSTMIGAAYYPPALSTRYAFPRSYRGGLFVSAHGSWHRTLLGAFAAEPMVAFVPMHGDVPATPADWNDPHRQWQLFVGGFQSGGYRRVGRPTGIAVGSLGSLFVADDAAGAIYRIRPKGAQ